MRLGGRGEVNGLADKVYSPHRRTWSCLPCPGVSKRPPCSSCEAPVERWARSHRRRAGSLETALDRSAEPARKHAEHPLCHIFLKVIGAFPGSEFVNDSSQAFDRQDRQLPALLSSEELPPGSPTGPYTTLQRAGRRKYKAHKVQ